MNPSSVSESRVDDEVSRAAFSLLLKEPFYAHVLAGMPREVTDRVETIAVAWNGQQAKLLVNPQFLLQALTPEERCALLKHEVLHVVFQHLFRQVDRDPMIADMAADLVVNQLVDPWPLPEGSVLLESFPDLNLQPDQTMDQYHAELIKVYREMLQNGYDQKKGETGIPDWAGKTSAPQSARAIDKFLSNANRGEHSQWARGDDSLATAAGRYAIGNVLIRARERMAAHQWGSLPGALQSLLDGLLSERQPKLDWRRTLRIFCAASGKTRIRHSVKRISKRYGTRPGIKIQRLQRLLVAIDTSGSIDQDMLETFFTEIHGISRTGATVTIVECDAEVQRHYEYRGQTPEKVEGGGGTAFEPVFRWMLEGRHFDGCIYLTDGYGEHPVTRPNCRLLWVVPGDDTGNGSEPLPFGETIWVPMAQGGN